MGKNWFKIDSQVEFLIIVKTALIEGKDHCYFQVKFEPFLGIWINFKLEVLKNILNSLIENGLREAQIRDRAA